MPQQRDATLEAELLQLQELGLQELRVLWSHYYGARSRCLSADLMRRRLAYEMQARAYGGLKPRTRRQLQRLYRVLEANPGWSPLPYRSFAIGTELTRVWRGKTHKVSILDEGFEYEGQQYDSLSEVAQSITGTKRSGPAFFGFREAPR